MAANERVRPTRVTGGVATGCPAPPPRRPRPPRLADDPAAPHPLVPDLHRGAPYQDRPGRQQAQESSALAHPTPSRAPAPLFWCTIPNPGGGPQGRPPPALPRGTPGGGGAVGGIFFCPPRGRCGD